MYIIMSLIRLSFDFDGEIAILKYSKIEKFYNDTVCGGE
mgnify:CR=1 FL=1